MIKLHCDRCGNEIKDEYYTMSFTKQYVNNANRLALSCGTITSIGTYIEQNELEKLKSQKIYCNKCKKEIEEMNLRCDTNITSLIESLKNDDRFEKLVKDVVKNRL